MYPSRETAITYINSFEGDLIVRIGYQNMEKAGAEIKRKR